MADPYVDRKTARKSYRPRNLMSPGLQRAREPFRLRNAITGVLLAGFTVGVWAYSIGAVKQDVFDDVDDEARALMARSGIQSAESATATVVKEVIAAPPVTVARPETKSSSSTSRRGVLPPLLEPRFPSLLDPSSKTIVWGAPPVDKVGRITDSIPGSKRV
ncbi:hypothetical protein TRAPUB_3833 [Trametes pubescens]|uniref:Cytochrome c oxidase assembly factor 3 n=1 Tax=Trametes pubescens TaxID=154538 RepID=A0A1M2VCS0_TRAPU|nr:hypothetical protein TRAPUB_3833 [Trametes pubescens]